MKIYGLGGLGVDERVFTHLNPLLKHPITPILWIPPHKGESLEDYAYRIAGEIDPGEKAILIGVSFGGMVASEISRIIKLEKLILISSAANQSELPRSLKLFSYTLFQIIPEKYIFPPFTIAKWFFSVKTKENSEILGEIIKNTNKSFVKWALTAMATWRARELPEKIIRIHGINDRVIPAKRKLNYHLIENSGHFAIVEDASAIAEIINTELKDLKI